MRPRFEQDSDIQAIIVLAGLFAFFIGMMVYGYQVYFAPCRAGTVEVSGWTGGRYTRLCVPNGSIPAPE